MMVNRQFALVIGTILALAAMPALADWNPGDGHKMHYPQLPDEQGWDVNATFPANLADDWRCSEDGPVLDFHFWGSWRDFNGDGLGDVGQIQGFTLRIWSDIPVDPPSIMYSRPGTLLWELDVDGWLEVPIDPPLIEHWYDPFNGEVVNNDHGEYFQYNIDLRTIPGIVPFDQIAGTIYWLGITAHVVDDGTGATTQWGWKSTIDHFNDDATFAQEGDWAGWRDMYEPPRYNEFDVALDLGGVFAGGGGTNYYTDGTDDHGWYYYPQFDWWNIWFYDNPFRFDHYKEAFINGQVMPFDPAQPSQVTIAVNFSTDAWSEQGLDRPPLPSDPDENLNIGRMIIWSWSPSQGPLPPTGVPIEEFWTLTDYNPEWISIDVQGWNFRLQGNMTHECVQTSLDLSFVITGDVTVTGACCWDDGSCTIVTQAVCEDPANPLLGTYMGDGIICLGDSDGDGNDDLCVPPVTGACCFTDGSCQNLTQNGCLAAGGQYQGDGTACLGDVNPANGVDDACETPTDEEKWHQHPDLETGDDVNCTYNPDAVGIPPYLLADDFECIQTGPITRINVYGSWYLDRLPLDDPLNVTFVLSIHEDIPDPDGQTGPEYSMPGDLICLIDNPTFTAVPFATGLREGWLEPPDYWTPWPDGDEVCWLYTFDVSEYECFQLGTPDEPRVYWLDVQAYPQGDANAWFGWKTTLDHWNDDAVWANAVDDGVSDIDWGELFFPANHSYYPDLSVDLAFTIFGQAGTPPTGACCFPDGTCQGGLTAADCAAQGGTYQGGGTVCLGDSNNDGIDDACGGAIVLGACCLQDGSCIATTANECGLRGGTYLGNNTVCLGDADGNGVDDACETPPNKGACCWPDGTCSVVTAAKCVKNGGNYLGDNSACLGDSDLNGVDDACETPDPDFKWEQLPDLDPTGYDVAATWTETMPHILADDFECTVTGPITRIHVYGSWKYDYLPPGGPTDVNFVLSIHEDIPAVEGDPDSYSRPGDLLCLLTDLTFTAQPYATDLLEGWWEPGGVAHFITDRVCWEYIFHLPPDICIQDGSSTNPITYWLDVQAYPAADPPPILQAEFGWKTSLEHWNDDATWAFGQDDFGTVFNWEELFYPYWHEFGGQSMDLAFKIIGSEGTPTPTGACCWPDGTCTVETRIDCENAPNGVFGTYQGDWTICAGDQNGNGVDDACENVLATGACCYDVGGSPQCTNTTQAECINLGGAWYAGQDCTDPNFVCPSQPPQGACCIEDAAGNMTCVNTSHFACHGLGGTWYLGQDCNDPNFSCPTPQPMGACCYGDPTNPSCVVTTEDQCKLAFNGKWYANQDCASFDCPTVIEYGACCYEDAVAGSSCVKTTQADCIKSYGGTWYAGQDCSTVDCGHQPPTGACCYGDPASPSCDNTTQVECYVAFGGTWYAGQDCDAAGFDCPIPHETGACCYEDAAGNEACANSTQLECKADYGGTWYANADCADIICPDPEPEGACCYGTPPVCVVTTEDQCDAAYGGTWHAGEDCSTFNCPTGDPMGACCWEDAGFVYCANTTESDCSANYTNSTWYAGQNCSSFDCPTTPRGACCWPDGTCTVETQADCQSSGAAPGVYQGDRTVCLGDGDGDGIDDACQEGPGFKWTQPPDLSPEGVDVRFTEPVTLADDFECTTPGDITEISIWVSWFHDEWPGDPGNVHFRLGLYTDIPDPDGELPAWSMPGDMVCWRDFLPGEFQWEQVTVDVPEGWYDPWAGHYEWPGDYNCFKLTFQWAPGECIQEGTETDPIVYWLVVEAEEQTGQDMHIGWKTSMQHWNDDATWLEFPGPMPPDGNEWRELRYPSQHPFYPQSIDFAFEIIGGTTIGACCFDDGTCMVMSPDRCNEHMGTYLGDDTLCDGDTDGNGVDDACETPPLGACCLLNGDCIVTDLNNCSKQHGTYLGNGIPCDGDADGNGIDDACEDPPFGACCLADGTCVDVTADQCMLMYGDYQGNTSSCQGDTDNNGVDDVCEEPPMGACCLPTGQCVVLTVAHCAAYQGQYLGNDVLCEGDADFNNIDDACEPPIGACCWPDGTCSLVEQSWCENPVGIPAGIYKGDGTVCHGDADLNGIDDGCEGPPTESKWEQPPDLTPLGMDVYATEAEDNYPVILADDFECTETGSILEIHVWGSWYMDAYPNGGPGSIPITLSLHMDIPDPDDSGPLYSQPGNQLWSRTFTPGQYTVEPYFAPNLTEGFFMTWNPYWLPGMDHNCWLYKFQLNPGEFIQDGTPTNPVVYWLDLQADVAQWTRYFGWKTSTDHWNDDGVWAVGQNNNPFTPWYELVYTYDHPYAGQSIDLAFRIVGEAATSCCEGRVGDANGVGNPPDEPTIGDVSVMIDALFISGLMSKIACIPEADVNQSGGPNPGTVDITIGDISVLIDYLFIAGAYHPVSNPSGVVLGACF